MVSTAEKGKLIDAEIKGLIKEWYDHKGMV
jgi:hypothetical protein